MPVTGTQLGTRPDDAQRGQQDGRKECEFNHQKFPSSFRTGSEGVGKSKR